MIINRLNILLAERTMKAKKLSLLTGIAQSTLTRITNNTSSQIDYDTLNKICNQLQIEPKDFFDYTPYDFEVSTELENSELSIYIKINKFNTNVTIVEFSGKLTRYYETIQDDDDSFHKEERLNLDFPEPMINFLEYLNREVNKEDFTSISIAIKQSIFQKVRTAIDNFVLDYYKDEAQDNISEMALIVDNSAELTRYVNNLEKEIISRLKTNLSFQGLDI
ncbi:helix-turn-helix domain-containing protein [Lactococcus petauri]|uniref:helix-turn-helix domain-containing protein n=1 Tax=Lactococcus petauri TaxID=1940789 RepID=UPI00254F2C9C|nr:helix-turn-helix transcriptional regulator [Lactococcus petauri]